MSPRTDSARDRWRRATIIARRAGNDQDPDSDDGSSSSSSSSSSRSSRAEAERRKAEKKRKEESKARRRKDAKTMGLQYFLEMVDLKHRYGSNLRTYHEEWLRADSTLR